MWLTDLFVNRPWTVVLFGGAIVGLFAVACVALESYLPSPITVRDLLDYDDPRT
jgi:hypothetical protein